MNCSCPNFSFWKIQNCKFIRDIRLYFSYMAFYMEKEKTHNPRDLNSLFIESWSISSWCPWSWVFDNLLLSNGELFEWNFFSALANCSRSLSFFSMAKKNIIIENLILKRTMKISLLKHIQGEHNSPHLSDDELNSR